jgi:carbonic anhydrase
VTFLMVPRLTRTLAAVPIGSPVELELAVDYLDHAGREALESWRTHHQRSGGIVRLHRRSQPMSLDPHAEPAASA